MKFSILTTLIVLITSISLSSCATQVEIDTTNDYCNQNPYDNRCKPAEKKQIAIDNPEQIKQAQRILSDFIHSDNKPYYIGDIHGTIDEQTRIALTHFQIHYGIKPAKGELDIKTFNKIKELGSNLPSSQKTVSIPQNNTIHTITVDHISKNVDNLPNNELYELTAYLKELGYYSGDIADATKRKAEIEKKLINFQKDFGILSNVVTNETWDRLKSIGLSDRTQIELDAAKGSKQITNNTVTILPPTKPTQITNTTQPIKIVKNNQQTNAVSQPKKQIPTVRPPQPTSPALPTFQLTAKQNVFAIEEVKCKNKNAAWITFYEGAVQNIENNQVEIQLADRYALWYDSRKQGVSYGDWWCIPRQRFCYAKVKFSDWGGTLKTGANYTVDKNKLIPTNTKLGRDEGIAALSAELADAQCGFKKKR
jgi:hypothetical protein